MAELNAGIILAGRQPDPLGYMARGNALAQQQNEMMQQRQLQDLYRTQGAGILNGDPGAMNALAGVNPMAAMDMRKAQQGYRMNEENLKIAKENARLRGAELAATMDARQRAETAAQIEKAIAMGTQAQTPEQWDQIMSSLGEAGQQFVGQYDKKNMIIAGAVGLAEAMKMGDRQGFRAATQDEAAGYGAQAGQFGPDGRFYPINPPSGTAMTVGPDGTVQFQQGAGVGGMKLTEGQSKDNVFVTRAEGALQAFEPVADSLTSRTEHMAESVPLGFGREMQSDNFQVAKQSGEEFLQAILRKDTGAAITAQEQELYGKTYLPQPGDGPAVLEAKRQSRARAVEALKAGMDPRQIVMTEKALVEAARRTGGQPAPQPQGERPGGALSDDDLLRKYGG